jgi:hypothetical protein
VRCSLVVGLLLVLAGPTHAELQAWNALFAQARAAPEGGVAAWFDLHARRRGGSSQLLIRPALGYAFGPSLLVHAGYVAVPTLVDDGDDQLEHRSWQQVIWAPTVTPDLKAQARLRVEQRFGGGDDVGHRLRGFVRGQWAASSRFQLVAWDEAFVQLNDTDWGPVAGFDQNRLFLGIGADTAVPGVRVEIGYLHVYLHAVDRMDHAVMVNVFANYVPGA